MADIKHMTINASGIKIGHKEPLVFIAGPCVVESEEIMYRTASELKSITEKLGVQFIFKASYDKANKTIPGAYRGPGWQKGLELIDKIKNKVNVKVLSDVHTEEQVKTASQVLDVLQIPALLSKQIDLILACGKSGRPVNIKKGQFVAPWEVNNVLRRLKENNISQVMVTERGTMFGYQTLVNDFRAIDILRTFGHPVLFDASHSVHAPQVLGEQVGGNRNFIPSLCKAAVAVGVDGLFMEVHPEPDRALSDSAGTFHLDKIEELLKVVIPIAKVSRG